MRYAWRQHLDMHRRYRPYDVDEADGAGYAALTWAGKFGWVVVVQMLLEQGADVNAEGGYNGNTLQEGSSKGRLEILMRPHS